MKPPFFLLFVGPARPSILAGIGGLHELVDSNSEENEHNYRTDHGEDGPNGCRIHNVLSFVYCGVPKKSRGLGPGDILNRIVLL